MGGFAMVALAAAEEILDAKNLATNANHKVVTLEGKIFKSASDAETNSYGVKVWLDLENKTRVVDLVDTAGMHREITDMSIGKGFTFQYVCKNRDRCTEPSHWTATGCKSLNVDATTEATYAAAITAVDAEVTLRVGNEFIVKTSSGFFEGSAAFGAAATRIAVPTATECLALKDAARDAARGPRLPADLTPVDMTTPPVGMVNSKLLPNETGFNELMNGTGTGEDSVDDAGGGGRLLKDGRRLWAYAHDLDARTKWMLSQWGAQPEMYSRGEYRSWANRFKWRRWQTCESLNSYASFFYRYGNGVPTMVIVFANSGTTSGFVLCVSGREGGCYRIVSGAEYGCSCTTASLST